MLLKKLSQKEMKYSQPALNFWQPCHKFHIFDQLWFEKYFICRRRFGCFSEKVVMRLAGEKAGQKYYVFG